MADKAEPLENPYRGNEWEVVSLTASTYAAAPGPRVVGYDKEDDNGRDVDEGNNDFSHPMFRSTHFIFPPSEHENLPLELDDSTAILTECQNREMSVVLDVENEASSAEVTKTSSANDEKDKEQEENEVMESYPSTRLDTKSYMHSYVELSSHQGEEVTPVGSDITESSDLRTSSIQDCSLLDIPVSPKCEEDDECAGPNLPFAGWWKRHTVSLYAYAREASTVWSIFLAAAVMGLVILRQRERLQLLHVKMQAGFSDVKTSWLVGPIIRFKDVFVGSPRRISDHHPAGL